MEEKGVRDLEQQALGPFRKSFTKRYEQWKRGDLLVLALETMPKQVDKDKLLRNLIKMTREREENFREQT
jgi:hypothetical protein